MHLKGKLYDVCHPVLRSLRTNRWIIHRLFGVRVPKGVAVQFDPTTLLLSTGLRSLVTSRDRCSFEVGIGQGALISLSLALSKNIQVSGVDCTASRVETSKALAEFNGVKAEYSQSDLFASVDAGARFDLIFFNPPYVPTETGKRLQLTRRLNVDGDQMWDGGHDGTAVLCRFLNQAPNYLTDHGRVVFGVQNLFVPDSRIQQVIADSQLSLQRRIKRRSVPSTGYVLTRTDHRSSAVS